MISHVHFAVFLLLICGSAGCGEGSGAPPPSGSIGPAAGAPPEAESDDWQLFRDERFGLSFRYPSVYRLRVWEEGLALDLLLRVGLLTPDAVGSPIEHRVPPAFAVEIYDNSTGRELESWMKEKGLAADGSRFTGSRVILDGREGLRVTDRTGLAPNDFWYVASGVYVFRFIPLGRYSQEILDSVELGPWRVESDPAHTPE